MHSSTPHHKRTTMHMLNHSLSARVSLFLLLICVLKSFSEDLLEGLHSLKIVSPNRLRRFLHIRSITNRNSSIILTLQRVFISNVPEHSRMKILSVGLHFGRSSQSNFQLALHFHFFFLLPAAWLLQPRLSFLSQLKPTALDHPTW